MMSNEFPSGCKSINSSFSSSFLGLPKDRAILSYSLPPSADAFRTGRVLRRPWSSVMVSIRTGVGGVVVWRVTSSSLYTMKGRQRERKGW